MDTVNAVMQTHEALRMILSFGDKAPDALYHGQGGKTIRKFPPTIRRVAIRKLDVLDGATVLKDLRSPPGNRLEALRGDLAGLHSIRVNDQWRILFRWLNGDAHDVRVIDYH